MIALKLIVAGWGLVTIAFMVWFWWQDSLLRKRAARRATQRSFASEEELITLEINHLREDFRDGIYDYWEFREQAKRLGLRDTEIRALLNPPHSGSSNGFRDQKIQRGDSRSQDQSVA